MSIIGSLDTLTEKEIIEELNYHGIEVIMKPMALLPDNLVEHNGIGRKSIGTVLVSLNEALECVKRRNSVMGEYPFF